MNNKMIILSGILFLFLFFSQELYAAVTTTDLTSNNILDIIKENYSELFLGIYTKVAEIAKKILLSFLLFDLIWLGFNHISDSDFSGFLIGLLRMIIVVGFGMWILDNPLYIMDGITGFKDVAAKTTGFKPRSAADFWEQGVRMANNLALHATWGRPQTWIIAVVGVVILWLFAKIAILILKIEIQCYALTAGGLLLVMFWGASFTRSYTQSFFTWMISVGMKQFMVLVLAAVGYILLGDFASEMMMDPTMAKVLAMLGVLGIYSGLINEVPSMVDSLVSGMGGGSIGGTANRAMAPITNAAKGATTAAVGGAMSITQAAKLAGAQGKTGVGKFGGTVSNLAKSALGDFGGRLSGSVSHQYGNMGGRMAGAMKQERLNMPRSIESSGISSSNSSGGSGAPSGSIAPAASSAGSGGGGNKSSDGGISADDDQGKTYFSGTPRDATVRSDATVKSATNASSGGVSDLSSDDIQRMNSDQIKTSKQDILGEKGSYDIYEHQMSKNLYDDSKAKGKVPGVKDDLARMKQTRLKLRSMKRDKK